MREREKEREKRKMSTGDHLIRLISEGSCDTEDAKVMMLKIQLYIT